MLAYLSYMAERLAECHRVLRDTGSIYLHCDPTASHYLKAVMDAVFGAKQFRNEITWQRAAGRAKGSQHAPKTFGNDCDSILFYGKSEKSQFNGAYKILSEEEMKAKFPEEDSRGRYNTSTPLFRQPSMGARPNLCYEYKGVRNPHPSGWRVSKEKLIEMDKRGEIIWRDGKRPLRKSYSEDYKGKPLGNLWTDINNLTNDKESTGYPTQKPVALLERIIKASVAKGNLVLDPFCGCGTTIAAAKNLGLDWVGIDISPLAIDVICKERFPGVEFPVHGIPVNLATARRLAKDRPFDFEKWAITRIPGLAPNDQQVADGGVDGRGHLVNAPDNHDSTLVLAQVKGGSPSVDQVKAFAKEIEDQEAAAGIFITLEPFSSPTAERVARGMADLKIGAMDYPRLQFWSIDLHFDNRPAIVPPMVNPLTGKEDSRQLQVL